MWKYANPLRGDWELFPQPLFIDTQIRPEVHQCSPLSAADGRRREDVSTPRNSESGRLGLHQFVTLLVAKMW